MCGICGFAYASTSEDAGRRVRSMAEAMRNRGPDEEGYLVNEPRVPGLALGMRRLSIIDLAGGHQPVWNESHDVAVVFNGELYNYRELRERLQLGRPPFSDPIGHGNSGARLGRVGRGPAPRTARHVRVCAYWICASISPPCQWSFWLAIPWESNHFIIRRRTRVSRLRPNFARCWLPALCAARFPRMR